MRAHYSLATVGLAAAVFAAATSPGFANEMDDIGCAIFANCTYHSDPPGTIHTTLDHPIKQGKTKKQIADEQAEKARKYQEYLAEQKASAKRQKELKQLNALGGGPNNGSKAYVGVVTGRDIKGRTSGTAGVGNKIGDWSSGGGHGGTTTNQTMSLTTSQNTNKLLDQPAAKPVTSAPQAGGWGSAPARR